MGMQHLQIYGSVAFPYASITPRVSGEGLVTPQAFQGGKAHDFLENRGNNFDVGDNFLDQSLH